MKLRFRFQKTGVPPRVPAASAHFSEFCDSEGEPDTFRTSCANLEVWSRRRGDPARDRPALFPLGGYSGASRERDQRAS